MIEEVVDIRLLYSQDKIVEDLKEMGIILPENPLASALPKFRLSLPEIDYAMLITKALFKKMVEQDFNNNMMLMASE